jgi:hypothetical protein
LPENIPHLTSPGVGGVNGGSGNSNIQLGTGGTAQSGSPVKESSFLNRETSAEDIETEEEGEPLKAPSRFANSIGPPTAQEGIPIRR